MEDIPGNFTPGSGIHALEVAERQSEGGIPWQYAHGLLDLMADKLKQSLLLVSDSGTILAAAGALPFAEGREDLRGMRWSALWPRESRPLAEGALQMVVGEAREVTIEVSRMPNARSAQCWEAMLSPLPISVRLGDKPHKSAVLIALRDVTAAKGAESLQSRRL
jgi:hypothetical protein